MYSTSGFRRAGCTVDVSKEASPMTGRTLHKLTGRTGPATEQCHLNSPTHRCGLNFSQRLPVRRYDVLLVRTSYDPARASSIAGSATLILHQSRRCTRSSQCILRFGGVLGVGGEDLDPMGVMVCHEGCLFTKTESPSGARPCPGVVRSCCAIAASFGRSHSG